MNTQSFLTLDWGLPTGVKACITTKHGPERASVDGNEHPYGGFNLGAHVGDNEQSVLDKRKLLYSEIGRPVPWFSQVHGTEVAVLEHGVHATHTAIEADAVFTRHAGLVCAVLTADCLPVLLASRDGDEVASVHCGWRGLAAGILVNTLAHFRCERSDVRAFLGPAISQAHFEVGADVRKAFQDAQCERRYAVPIERFFVSSAQRSGKFRADLYGLACSELNGLGVHNIAGGNYCTYADEKRFYSYRRTGVTGRMASLIWISP